MVHPLAYRYMTGLHEIFCFPKADHIGNFLDLYSLHTKHYGHANEACVCIFYYQVIPYRCIFGGGFNLAV